jgi:hypothetical protein
MIVAPAKAGAQVLPALTKRVQTWVPAFAGTTVTKAGATANDFLTFRRLKNHECYR